MEIDLEDLKELIDGQEPFAIVRYFEWPKFSKDDRVAKYVLLRLDNRDRDIYEVPIPSALTSFLMSRLNDFQQVCRQVDGNVWELRGFRSEVSAYVTRAKINQFINE